MTLTVTHVPRVKFLNIDCQVLFGRYSNGRVAISLFSDEHGPVADATINVPCMSLADNQVLIKDYSENEGILKALEDAGIVRRADTSPRQVGFGKADVCTLLVDVPKPN